MGKQISTHAQPKGVQETDIPEQHLQDRMRDVLAIQAKGGGVGIKNISNH